MTVVTVTDPMQAVLVGLKDRAELRDHEGNLLGYFTPKQIEEEILYRNAMQAFDPEDIARRLAEEKEGLPLEEVLKNLNSPRQS